MSTLQLYIVSIGHRAWSELQLLNPPDDEPQMTVTGKTERTVVLSGTRGALALLVARADAMIECLHSNLPGSRTIDYGRQALLYASKRMHAELAAPLATLKEQP